MVYNHLASKQIISSTGTVQISTVFCVQIIVNTA